MSVEVVVAAALFAGIVVYALLGGADFGSGFYDAIAGRAAAGAGARTLIDRSIGPVWEANHVWLVYVLVMWWTAFPETFAAAATTLWLPLMLALLGIVLRGASFAFRKYAATLGQAQFFGVTFAGSSLITPFFLGAAAGAVASGRVPLDGTGDLTASWTTVTSMLAGTLAVASCAFLAGVFLTAEADRRADTSLADWFRARSLGVGATTGVLAVGALPLIAADAPTLGSGLQSRAAPVVTLSVLAGCCALILLYRRRYGHARVAAVLAVAAITIGWGVAQYPWVLVGEATVSGAAGDPATLAALLVAIAIAAVVVLPAFAVLLWFTQSATATRTAASTLGASRHGSEPSPTSTDPPPR